MDNHGCLDLIEHGITKMREEVVEGLLPPFIPK